MASPKRTASRGKTVKRSQPSKVAPLPAPHDVDPLPVAQGWKQFLTSRKKMLNAYDRAKETAKAHEVETYQGVVAEAQFRKWISDFLPKRYAVTPGYIVSQRVGKLDKLPHFDVIIYDALNSPVLWIDEHPDASARGTSRAIPAEHVLGVLEVKSSLNSTSALKAIAHLFDLAQLLENVDDPTERYRKYVPPNFFCGVVFFELLDKHKYSEAAVKNLIRGWGLRGFLGGIILRAEGHSKPNTARLRLLGLPNPIPGFRGRSRSLLDSVLTGSVPGENNQHYSMIPMWSESAFAEFAFDLVAIMQGTFKFGQMSSFHGFGSSGWDP